MSEAGAKVVLAAQGGGAAGGGRAHHPGRRQGRRGRAHRCLLDDVRALVEQAVATSARSTSATTTPPPTPTSARSSDTEDAAWDKTFEVNVKGYFAANPRGGAPPPSAQRARLDHQRRQHRRPARRADAGRLRHDQGGHHLHECQTLAAGAPRLDRRIRVNAIAPGLVDTKFAAAIVGNGRDPQSRWSRAPPSDATRSPTRSRERAVYLASDASSSYVTGQVLVVDGEARP